MSSNARSVAMGVAAVALVAGLVWVALRPEAVPVDLATVATGPMRVTIDGDGVTRIRNIYEVAAPARRCALRSRWAMRSRAARPSSRGSNPSIRAFWTCAAATRPRPR
jgi:HlyD family secretion protein